MYSGDARCQCGVPCVYLVFDTKSDVHYMYFLGLCFEWKRVLHSCTLSRKDLPDSYTSNFVYILYRPGAINLAKRVGLKNEIRRHSRTSATLLHFA